MARQHGHNAAAVLRYRCNLTLAAADRERLHPGAAIQAGRASLGGI